MDDLLDTYECRVYRPDVMRSSVNNSKSRAYQRAIAKNLESQRRLNSEYENLDYDMLKARSGMNSEIYRLKADLYRIRSKTPTLEEFRHGKTIAGVDNFHNEVASLSNDFYEIVNGKVTRKHGNSSKPNTRPGTTSSTRTRSASRGSKPAKGKGQASRKAPPATKVVNLIPVPFTNFTAPVDIKVESRAQNKDTTGVSLSKESQAAALNVPSVTEIGEKMDEILDFSKNGKSSVHAHKVDEASELRPVPLEPERDKTLDKLLGRATAEDVRTQTRTTYGLDDSDSDLSDNDLSAAKQLRGLSAPPQGHQDTGRRDPRKPHIPRSSLASRSRRIRSRKGLTPRQGSSPSRYETPTLDADALMNPHITSGNPYQDMFKPEIVTVQRVVRMSIISRKLHEIEAFREQELEDELENPKFVLEKKHSKQTGKDKRRVRYDEDHKFSRK